MSPEGEAPRRKSRDRQASARSRSPRETKWVQLRRRWMRKIPRSSDFIGVGLGKGNCRGKEAIEEGELVGGVTPPWKLFLLSLF